MMGPLQSLMSADAVWVVVAATVLPTLGALWWYVITKVNHLYSKIAELKEMESVQVEQIERLRHDHKNIKMVVEWNSEQHKAREMDINYLYWAQIQKDGNNNEQGFPTSRPSNRQPFGRPEQP